MGRQALAAYPLPSFFAVLPVSHEMSILKEAKINPLPAMINDLHSNGKEDEKEVYMCVCQEKELSNIGGEPLMHAVYAKSPSIEGGGGKRIEEIFSY